MKDSIAIPSEALEAALKEFQEEGWHPKPKLVRAACLAMLKAWPQMSAHDRCKWSVMPDVPLIILPLQKETGA